MALARPEHASHCTVVPPESDRDGGAFAAFDGSRRGDGMVGSRALDVAGPDGRLAGVIPRFAQADPAAGARLAPRPGPSREEPPESP